MKRSETNATPACVASNGSKRPEMAGSKRGERVVRAYLVVADVDEDLAHDGVEFLSAWLTLGRLDDETLERL